MPNTKNSNKEPFAAYDAMTTEELRQLLKEDASNHEGDTELSMDALLYIMQLLARRRQTNRKSPEEALEDFRKYYINVESESDSKRDSEQQKKNKSAFPRWAKALTAAAAVFVLFLGCAFTAKAFDHDVFEIIAHWTKDTFSLGPSSQQSATEEINSAFPLLQSKLKECGIQSPLVPTWLPEGYTEQLVDVHNSGEKRSITSVCQKNELTIHVFVEDYQPDKFTLIEQSGSTAEIYEVNGVKYYIFFNKDRVKAAWIRDGFFCCISGPISLSELKEMVDSIEKG